MGSLMVGLAARSPKNAASVANPLDCVQYVRGHDWLAAAGELLPLPPVWSGNANDVPMVGNAPSVDVCDLSSLRRNFIST